jgi:cell division septation protein DedD
MTAWRPSVIWPAKAFGSGALLSVGIGASGSITVGKVLAPVNHLVEQFAEVMLAASVAFGLMKLGLVVGEAKVLSAFLTLLVAGCLFYLKGSEFAAATENPKPQAAVPNTGPPTATNESRFTFYKTLPATEASPTRNHEGTDGKMPASATADKTSTYLQVGAFQSAADAESQKAKLALVGIESAIQVADLPGKGKLFRVAVGPLTSAADQARVRNQLLQAGIPFFDMRKDN